MDHHLALYRDVGKKKELVIIISLIVKKSGGCDDIIMEVKTV